MIRTPQQQVITPNIQYKISYGIVDMMQLEPFYVLMLVSFFLIRQQLDTTKVILYRPFFNCGKPLNKTHHGVYKAIKAIACYQYYLPKYNQTIMILRKQQFTNNMQVCDNTSIFAKNIPDDMSKTRFNYRRVQRKSVKLQYFSTIALK